MSGMRGFVLILFAGALWAQEKPELVASEDWITLENCQRLRDEAIKEIEEFTRIQYRRPVPINIMSSHEYSAYQGAGGMAGWVSAHAAAFYSPDTNEITVIPFRKFGPAPAAFWEVTTRGTMIHEMTHALHHQNFWTQGPHHNAAAKIRGLTEDEIDAATVDNLLNEGFAELVEYGVMMNRVRAARLKRLPREIAARVGAKPAPKPASPAAYMKRYVPDPDTDEPYRVKLLSHVYGDGLTLMYHLMMQGGMRAVRSALYRPPHRLLLFQPSILVTADLSDPPEPDAIFALLHAGPLSNEGIRLATRPGPHRYFGGAREGHDPGCLLGYVARATSGPFDGSEYAFFIADPDRPGTWAVDQLETLEKQAKRKIESKKVKLPLSKSRATLTIVPQDNQTYLHGEIPGVVVLVKIVKDKITNSDVKRMQERVVYALRALEIKKPKAFVFKDALEKARTTAGYR
jgi:hypothetical protein